MRFGGRASEARSSPLEPPLQISHLDRPHDKLATSVELGISPASRHGLDDELAERQADAVLRDTPAEELDRAAASEHEDRIECRRDRQAAIVEPELELSDLDNVVDGDAGRGRFAERGENGVAEVGVFTHANTLARISEDAETAAGARPAAVGERESLALRGSPEPVVRIAAFRGRC